MKKLNIACGNRIHEDWINIDFHKSNSSVISVNILKGLPFEDNSFDFIYCSHFLEHLKKEQVDFVLSEIYRILKFDGVVRLVVPDLENICKEYLHILSSINSEENSKKYEWIIIELLDQLVRVDSGGEMAKFYNNKNNILDEEIKQYIFERVGERICLSSVQNKTFKDRLKKLNKDKIFEKLLYLYISLVKKMFPKSIRDSFILNTSVGEKHLWMYDKYSLSKIINKAGFSNSNYLSYNESSISDFNKYHLDCNPDGTSYKGCSSLYCEAFKK